MNNVRFCNKSVYVKYLSSSSHPSIFLLAPPFLFMLNLLLASPPWSSLLPASSRSFCRYPSAPILLLPFSILYRPILFPSSLPFLGPLLFLIYINDMVNSTQIGEFILFADDTNLLYSHDNVSSLSSLINSELSKLSVWLQVNKLSINITKSNYIIFKPRQKRLILDLNLEINHPKVNRASEVCFLGVILDENLLESTFISYCLQNLQINWHYT